MTFEYSKESLAAVTSTGDTQESEYFDDYQFPLHKLQPLPVDKADATPVLLVACGSYSPVTYLHLRMFEMAKDLLVDHPDYYPIGGVFSPVSDAYKKPGLVPWQHRVQMCELATANSDWITVDPWESRQQSFQRTAWVLAHVDRMVNEGQKYRGVDGKPKRVRIMLLAGGDLIQSFAVPDLWKEGDVHKILGTHGCVIIERPGADISEYMLKNDILYEHRHNIYGVKQHISNDISSTKLRLFVKRKFSIKYLAPDSVIQYIDDNKLYM
ncbi:hypothetical protein DFS34DRAFT_584891 [Phlyctochytrium arcticum]|nr:hypothetical protein DFS34DRAFT_584891 [Phlyctochytrium arcticum]